MRTKNKRIEILESSVTLKQHHMDILFERNDDLEQYTRRHSVRINGIEVKPENDKGKAEDIYKIVEKCYVDVGLKFESTEINRAHRVGLVKTYSKSGKRTQSIIVQFRNWNARCNVFKNRPKFHKKKPGEVEVEVERPFSVSLDLTKRRLELLTIARNESKNHPDVDYVFTDINCNIVLKMVNGKNLYLKRKIDLDGILKS